MPVTRMIVTVPQLKGQVISLDRPNMTIGRAAACDVIVDSCEADDHHAELCIGETLVQLKDLSSQTGIFVNGRRTQTCILKDLDVIEIGGCLLRFVALDDGAPSTATRGE